MTSVEDRKKKRLAEMKDAYAKAQAKGTVRMVYPEGTTELMVRGGMPHGKLD